jgi:aminoglycoside 3-N-acetyltransferase
VYELDGHVLLLGVTNANNTSLHLAEVRAAPPDAATMTCHSPVVLDGERRWATYGQLIDHDGDFELIGEAFAATGRERAGPVGSGTGRLMRARDLVDFAADRMSAHRSWPVADE